MTVPVQTLCLMAGEVDTGVRLDAWLAAKLPGLSRTRIQALMRQGCILVDGRDGARPRDRVAADTAYRVLLPPTVTTTLEAESIPLDVLYEDNDLIVINKPPGMVVHPAPGHSGGTLVNALLHHCHELLGVGGERRPGIVHRLDKDTSGVLVVAKHQGVMESLAAQFQSRQVGKTYIAVVAGIPDPPSGRIETDVGRSRHDRKKMSATPGRGKPAVTHYRVEERLCGFALVRLRIETGRTHQIRVQMAHIGCPVAGDDVYGGGCRQRWAKLDGVRRQLLHAEELVFTHPSTGMRVTFRAPVAPDMAAVIETLRAAAERAEPGKRQRVRR